MTTPPVDPVPQSNAPQSADAPESVPNSATTDQEVRDLAATVLAAIPPPADLVRKATVTALTLPTCTIQFPVAEGSTAVDVPDVVCLDSYTPVVGDVVLTIKQGTDLFAIGQLNTSAQGGSSQGWATLAGNVQYRLVVDNGDSKIQLKGNTGYTATIGTLPVGFRPSATRSFSVARDGQAASIRCSVSTAGTVSLVEQGVMTSAADGGDTTSSLALALTTNSLALATDSVAHSHSSGSHTHGIGHNHGGTTDVRLSGYLSQAGTDLGHAHLISTGASSAGYSDTGGGTVGSSSHDHTTASHGHTGSTATHSHTQPAHTHTVDPTNPTSVWFDGVEFFL